MPREHRVDTPIPNRNFVSKTKMFQNTTPNKPTNDDMHFGFPGYLSNLNSQNKFKGPPNVERKEPLPRKTLSSIFNKSENFVPNSPVSFVKGKI